MKSVKILKSKSKTATKENYYTTLSETLKDIKASSVNRVLLEAYRDQRTIEKVDLPVIYFSLNKLKTNYRIGTNVSEHSGIIVIDLDNLSGEAVEELRKLLKNNKYVLSFFYSPSKQLKVLFRVEPSIQKHKDNYRNICDYLESEFLMHITTDSDIDIIDRSGSNLSRACFISYDPDIYINYNCSLFDLTNTNKKVDIPKDKERGDIISPNVQFFNKEIDDRIDDGSGMGIFNYRTRLSESVFSDPNQPFIIQEGIPTGYAFARWQQTIKEGGRHKVLGAVSIVMIYNNRSLPIKNIIGMTSLFNDRFCLPPIDHEEVAKIVESNYEKFHDGSIDINALVESKTLRPKKVFWSRYSNLSKNEKLSIGRKLLFKEVIEERGEVLKEMIEGITSSFSDRLVRNRLAEELGVSDKTVARTFVKLGIDFNSIRRSYNRDFFEWRKEFNKMISEIEEGLDEDLEDRIRTILIPEEYKRQEPECYHNGDPDLFLRNIQDVSDI